MVTIDILNAGEELQRSFCAEKRREFWEILDAALAEADCKSVCPAEFREWLDVTDFFTAPASTKFHDDFPGGLVAHSIAVYRELTKIIDAHDCQYTAVKNLLTCWNASFAPTPTPAIPSATFSREAAAPGWRQYIPGDAIS